MDSSHKVIEVKTELCLFLQKERTPSHHYIKRIQCSVFLVALDGLYYILYSDPWYIHYQCNGLWSIAAEVGNYTLGNKKRKNKGLGDLKNSSQCPYIYTIKIILK